MRMLQTHAPAIFSDAVFILKPFDDRSLGRPFHALKKLAQLAKLVRSICSKSALEASGLDSKNWKLNQLKLKLLQH